MSAVTAKVLYEFSPQEEGDLGIVAGEILTLINPNCGNGWAIAKNDSGLSGMIPADYVEIISIPEPSIPPPPIPNEYVDIRTPVEAMDDSDWEDSDENESPALKVHTAAKSGSRSVNVSSVYGDSKLGNIKMPKSFMKYGGEEFLLGTGKPATTPEATIEAVIEGNTEIVRWKVTDPSEKIATISEHAKETKFRGMKSFVSYTIDNSILKGQIKHRYKQFAWVCDQMVDKYPCIIVPSLPSPKVVGRFEEDFVESRKKGLQRWLNYIMRHPVLSNSNLVRQFMTQSPESKTYKESKRQVEKDIYKGGKFFLAVSAPESEVIWEDQSKRLERVSNFQDNLERSIKAVIDSIANVNKKESGQIFQLYKKFGGYFCQLSRALSLSPDNDANDISLVHAVQKTGEAYEKVGKLYNEEGQKAVTTEEELEDFHLITKDIPSLIDISKCAIATVETGYRKSTDSKVSLETVECLDHNVRSIVRSIDAELNWLQNDREKHMRHIIKNYLASQVQLYSNITSILTDALNSF